MSFVNWNQLQNTLLGRRTQPSPAANDVPSQPTPAIGPAAPGGPIDHLLPQNDANGNAAPRDKKTLDPLFGPNIGAVTSGPAWTAIADKKLVTDDLTPEVVTTWIEKSRDPTQPTTTLQALVNLKRPTIKLSPLVSDDAEDHEHHPSQPHGLEFEYDCDAPKCGLYVHVFLPKTHPDAPPTPPHHPYAKLLVFENVVDGGFTKHLRLDEGAVLELGQFEDVPPEEPVITTNEEAKPATEEAPTARQRRRFTALRFRRALAPNHSISGPALAVVDAEPQEAPLKGTKPDSDEGVKVTIRLAALDDQGTELSNINEQVTYLHIVRVGQKPESGEDIRPWVVRVVKREATIGPHTFHLHEIYGLTNTSASKPAAPANDITDLDDDPQAECLLCLSSPREVVLLPCRHLVACKECALNMVEFGAGGNITTADAGPTSPADEAPNTEAVQTPIGGVTVTLGAATGAQPTNARRKRKAKGWFCPVCRQPYTSLLRITTSPLALDASKDGIDLASSPNSAVDGLPTLGSLSISNEVGTTSPRAGFLTGTFRPNFLRTLTGRGQQPATAQPPVEMVEPARPTPLDVESVGGLGRVGS